MGYITLGKKNWKKFLEAQEIAKTRAFDFKDGDAVYFLTSNTFRQKTIKAYADIKTVRNMDKADHIVGVFDRSYTEENLHKHKEPTIYTWRDEKIHHVINKIEDIDLSKLVSMKKVIEKILPNKIGDARVFRNLLNMVMSDDEKMVKLAQTELIKYSMEAHALEIWFICCVCRIMHNSDLRAVLNMFQLNYYKIESQKHNSSIFEAISNFLSRVDNRKIQHDRSILAEVINQYLSNQKYDMGGLYFSAEKPVDVEEMSWDV